MTQQTTTHDMPTLVTTEVMTLTDIDRHKLDIIWQVACLAGCMDRFLFTSLRLGAQLESCVGGASWELVDASYWCRYQLMQHITILIRNGLSSSMIFILFGQIESSPTPMQL